MSDFLDEGLADMDRRLGMDEAPAEPAETAPEAEVSTEAGVPADAGIEPEAESQERPRDEQGRFTKVEEEPKLLAGKFQSQEDLERAYIELQSLEGRRGTELGELRKELAAARQEWSSRPEPEPVSLAIGDEDFNQALEQNPKQAVEWAAQHDRSGLRLEQALDYWYDVEPRRAAAWERARERQEMMQAFEARLGEVSAPIADVAVKNGLEDAWATVQEEFPDLNQRVPHITKALEFAPRLAQGLQSRDAEERVSALKEAYYLGRGLAGSQPAAEGGAIPAEEAAAAVEAATAAKLDGTVASQTQTGDPEQKSFGDTWLEEIGFDAYLDRPTA